MNSKLDCTIVILSYNASEVTDTCLSKVEVAVKYCTEALKNEVKVIVVDNGSVDGSPEMIRKKHPSVKLMALKENIGYAKGNNLAMQAADTPYILLMNSDTYINQDSLQKTLAQMQNRSECNLLVSRCVHLNGVFQNYGGHLPTPLRIILWSFGFESVPILRDFLPRIYSYTDEFYKHEGIMEWCPPCFFLLEKKVFDKTHGFDEQMWFHMVDAEWCHRIHQQGFVIGYTPTIEVIHIGGASSKDIKTSLMRDNFKGLTHFCRKHYSKNVPLVFFFLKTGLKIRSLFYLLIGKQALSVTYNDISHEITA